MLAATNQIARTSNCSGFRTDPVATTHSEEERPDTCSIPVEDDSGRPSACPVVLSPNFPCFSRLKQHVCNSTPLSNMGTADLLDSRAGRDRRDNARNRIRGPQSALTDFLASQISQPSRSPQTTSDGFTKPPKLPQRHPKKTRKMSPRSTRMVRMRPIARSESERRRWPL